MQIHRHCCIYNYDTTQEVFEVEKVVEAYVVVVQLVSEVDRGRWMLVKWKDHAHPEWEPTASVLSSVCQRVLLLITWWLLRNLTS